MSIVRVIAEGVGPFQRLDLDLSDPRGGNKDPHLGPHIFAGVNGSGKSTVLKAIACAFARGSGGFDYIEWSHRLAGHARSGVAVFMKLPKNRQVAQVYVFGPKHSPTGGIEDWFRSVLHSLPPEWGLVRAGREHEDWRFFEHKEISSRETAAPPGDRAFHWGRFGNDPGAEQGFCAAYSPTPSLRYVDQPDIRKTLDPADNALAFESTIRNEDLQAWLHRVHYKKAVAQTRGQPDPDYPHQIEALNAALSSAFGSNIRLDVVLEPLQLEVEWDKQRLNFSQLPDGIRSTLGWVADFMMRRDLAVSRGVRYGPASILLLDEADSHLHPRWQRTLLPALRQALSNVQIIVTSHSPFVISSCPGARVHVLEVDEAGHARPRTPEDAPVGQSVIATLHDVFDVDSRFDVQTESELAEWNDLKKVESTRNLAPSERSRLQTLTKVLADRSEELRSIVLRGNEVSPVLLERLLRGDAAKNKKADTSSKKITKTARHSRRKTGS